MYNFGAPLESEGLVWYLLNLSKAHAQRGFDNVFQSGGDGRSLKPFFNFLILLLLLRILILLILHTSPLFLYVNQKRLAESGGVLSAFKQHTLEDDFLFVLVEQFIVFLYPMFLFYTFFSNNEMLCYDLNIGTPC